MSVYLDLLTRYPNIFCGDFAHRNIELHKNKVLIQLNFRSSIEENILLLDSFLLLEWLCGQRPSIKTLKFITPFRGAFMNKKIQNNRPRAMLLQILLQCTVRGSQIFYLLNFLELSFNLLQDKYISICAKIHEQMLFLQLTDYDSFVMKPEYILYFAPLNFFIHLGERKNFFFLQKKYTNIGRFCFFRDLWSNVFTLLRIGLQVLKI